MIILGIPAGKGTNEWVGREDNGLLGPEVS